VSLSQRSWSLQRRLALTLTAAVAALWLVGTAGAGLVLRRETDEVFDSALQEVAERVLPLAYAELLSRETTEAQRVVTIGPKAEHIKAMSYATPRAPYCSSRATPTSRSSQKIRRSDSRRPTACAPSPRPGSRGRSS
jgi:hypothetical protein